MHKKLIVLLLLSIMPISAWAAKQTYKVKAVVSNIYESSYGALPAPLKIGDEITMTYSMDDAKQPEYQSDWDIGYYFSQNEGSMQVARANVTINSSALGHHVGINPSNGNGVRDYEVWSYGSFDHGDVYGINLILISNTYSQSYTPWLTPDLSKFNDKVLDIQANTYTIHADVTSIVNEPFSVWPGDGSMHEFQHFDVFLAAPDTYDVIEFLPDPTESPRTFPCETLPSYNGQIETRVLCRDLDAGKLGLYAITYNGMTIRLRNTSTGKSVERVINWRMVH